MGLSQQLFFAQGCYDGGACVGGFPLHKESVKEEKESRGGRRIAARSLHKRVISEGKREPRTGERRGYDKM